MSWHYQATRQLIAVHESGPEYLYEVREVYTDPDGYTERAALPQSHSYAGLCAELIRMRHDVSEWPVMDIGGE